MKMKSDSKSHRHKSENTFKFQNFSERLANVNIDVIRRIGKTAASPEDTETFFNEALIKWTDLNCTEHFSNFRNEVFDKVDSLAQLVHHEKYIVDTLIKHIQVNNSLALQPMLDLVVQLARDLQKEFYKYFPDFFDVIMKLLQNYTKDTDTLEWAFTCLSYLFKFLWRYMVNDINNVYILFSALLGDEQKVYITNFATQSIAFLLRKVKDQNGLYDFIFTRLEEHPGETKGVGKMLFEAIKGVKDHLHSTHETVLPLLFSKLGQSKSTDQLKLPYDAILKALKITVLDVATHCKIENVQPLIKILLKCTDEKLNEVAKAPKKDKILFSEHLNRLLKLILTLVEFKKAVLVANPKELSKLLTKVVQISALGENVAETLLSVISTLLLGENCRVPMDTASSLVSQVFKKKFSTTLIGQFTRRMFPYVMFEKDVLPNLMTYCHQSMSVEPNVESLNLLTDLVLYKCPQMDDASQLENYNTYLLDFNFAQKGSRKEEKTVPGFISTLLTNNPLEITESSQYAQLWAAVVCLPHVRPLNKIKCISSVCDKNLKILFEKVKGGSLEDKYSMLLYQAVASLTLLTEPKEFFNCISTENVIDLLRSNPSSLFALRIADIYFTQASSNSTVSLISTSVFEKIYPILRKNLQSCYHLVRLLTLRIFSQFELQMPEYDQDVERFGVFRVCLAAEKIPISVQDHRQKIYYLNKIEYHAAQKEMHPGLEPTVPLLYFLGVQYVNFTMLWEPVNQLICSYAQNLAKDIFWPVFIERLKFASDMIESSPAFNPTNLEEFERNDIADLFKRNCLKTSSNPEKVDHFNYRHLLWKAMMLFPEQCEPQTRHLSPLLMRMIKNEFYPADSNTATTEDIRNPSTAEAMETNEKRNDDEDQDEDVEDQDVQNDDQPNRTGRKKVVKSLITKLTLYSKFHAPYGVSMEPTLHAFYLELLSHRDITLQTAGFACLMTYKYKYLTPYREHFERLLDDKSFKNEIVLFSIDHESGVVEENHREKLLPILMRILFGKMQSKTGKDTGGKNHSQLRKTIILRFLAGCRENEIKEFMDLVYGPFKEFVTDDPSLKLTEMIEILDLKCVIPIRRQQSILSTLDVIIKKLGNHICSYLGGIFSITLCVTGLCNHLLNIRSQINPKAVTSLKTLRNMGMARILQFYTSFDAYEFSKYEINGTFQAAVWPQLQRLSNEGIYTPTPLMKLFHLWSGFERYQPFLGKYHMNPSLNPMEHIVLLLSAPGAHLSVRSMIMEILENLVAEPEVNVDEEKLEPLIVEPVVQPDSYILKKFTDVKSIGLKLVLPHVPAILMYLTGVVREFTTHKGKKVPLRDLNVLSNLSKYVQDPEQSSKIVELLIPYLSKSVCRKQDTEIDILQTVANLMKLARDPEKLVRALSKLFASLSTRGSRTALCSVLSVISGRVPSFVTVASTITKLNAWNPKRMDEPDYNTRLDAFQEINATMKDLDEPNIDYFMLVAFNCFFFLNTSDDMSMRDSSSYCLQVMIRHLGTLELNSEVMDQLVNAVILNQIKIGLQSKSEILRHEYLKILGLAIRAFPKHNALSRLETLTNQDYELDFFENLRHIQLHRRSRALYRFVKHLSAPNTMTSQVLVQYILPVVTSFLTDALYDKHQVIIDSSIASLAAICKQLVWAKYLSILREFLRQLTKSFDNQKKVVKIIVAILDSFHFDLSTSKQIESAEPTEVLAKTRVDATGYDDDEIATSQEEIEVSTLEKCTPENATNIHGSIVKIILPELRRCLVQKAKSDDEHKMAGGKYAEDVEILRVPIALAIIKILQQLPAKSMQIYLPGVLLRICEFLKSRAKDIRTAARETLINISGSLGHAYLPFILRELKSSLTRGYQLHVLGFTVNSILRSMIPHLKYGQLDSTVPLLISIFNEEIFGNVAEEKEVDAIRSKFMEAKSIKSYGSYEIVAKFISKGMLTSLIRPLKEILDETYSHKVTNKVSEVLRHITSGLIDNSELPSESLMVFIHGLTCDALPFISNETRLELNEKPEKKSRRPESAYLITSAPGRLGFKPKTSTKTNAHIVVEFGLQLLGSLLKRSRLESTKKEHLQLLDPFVAVLIECLDSKHIKITSTALRCLTWMYTFTLPAMDKTNLDKCCSSMFNILKNYAVSGAAKGDNFELVVVCFKAMTVFIRDVKVYKISEEQLRILLYYIEEDMHDYTRQATAFSLLKGVLVRKLNCLEINDVMKKTAHLSITAESPHVRLQCRQVVLQFLLDYPLGMKLSKHLEFYVKQLDYELETGRESALEMLATMFTSFPAKIIHEFSGFFFVPMAMVLINDDSIKCRKLCALAVKSLIEKLNNSNRDHLISLVIQWCTNDNKNHRRLGAQVLGLFIETEATDFERHLPKVLPIFTQQIDASRYSEVTDENETRSLDYLISNFLSSLLKLFKECNLIRNPKWADEFERIWENVKELITYHHAWVRLTVAKLFGLLFSAWKPEELAKKPKSKDYITIDTRKKLESIAADFLTVFKSQMVDDLADQVIKNLVFIAKTVRLINFENKGEGSLLWMIKQLNYETVYEASQNQKTTLKRTCVFKWLGAVSLDLGKDYLEELLPNMLPPLVRESTNDGPSADDGLKKLANEVMELMKNTSGIESFTKIYAQIEKGFSEKRINRKRQKAIDAVSNPSVAAKRKMKKHINKQETKKRKIADYRPSQKVKKMKLKNMAFVE